MRYRFAGTPPMIFPHRLLAATLYVVALGAAAATPALVSAAREQTRNPVTYDGAYTRLAYPMGDVAPDRGVCTDVVIRAYRAIGIDLQVLIHEDMRTSFALYPANLGPHETRPQH